MNKQIITIVDAPEVTLADGQKAADLLLNFYQALGWDGNDYLDPCRVRTTKEVYNRLYDQIYEICPDPIGVGFLMVNRGPGTDDYIPPGKVWLLDGWIKPVGTEEGENNNGYQQQAV